MIFVTTGTSRFKFKRLINWSIQAHNLICPKEKMIIQAGSYKPHNLPPNIQTMPFYDYSKMISYIKKSRVIVSHAGMGTVLLCNMLKKKPIVVAREKSQDEHISDHQLSGVRYLNSKKLIYKARSKADLVNFFRKLKNTNTKQIRKRNTFIQAFSKSANQLLIDS